MGTRSLTYVYDGKRPIMCMYRQFDGYPSGHGNDLYQFLKNMVIVNGIGDYYTGIANGEGCLAAQIVHEFKNGPGGIYLYPTSPRNMDAGQDYEYEIHVAGAEGSQVIRMKIMEPSRNKRKGAVLFDGAVADFPEWLRKHESN